MLVNLLFSLFDHENLNMKITCDVVCIVSYLNCQNSADAWFSHFSLRHVKS